MPTPTVREARALPATCGLALAGPTAAQSSRLASKLYLPTALLALQLPAGMADLSVVPRLRQQDEVYSQEQCIAEYISAIRATVRVFATYNH